jgi:hypothetical protein
LFQACIRHRVSERVLHRVPEGIVVERLLAAGKGEQGRQGGHFRNGVIEESSGGCGDFGCSGCCGGCCCAGIVWIYDSEGSVWIKITKRVVVLRENWIGHAVDR